MHVEFRDDRIIIEGPPDQVEQARRALENNVAELVRTVLVSMGQSYIALLKYETRLS